MKNLLNFLKLISVLRGYSASQLKMVCNEEKSYFLNFNIDSRISLCARAYNSMYVEGRHQGHRMAIAEFKVHLIHN